MILQDSKIAEEIGSGHIGMDPMPEPEQVQPASLDLLLGENYERIIDEQKYTDVDEVVLEPYTPYLAHTRERVEVPKDLAVFMTGRSTLGRMGVLVHMTAGWIDPGFQGQIDLEMINFTSEPVHIDVGKAVAQLVFFKLLGESQGYQGQYQDQEGL